MSQGKDIATRISLEEEISSFGTGLSRKEQDDTEEQYENTFYDDPGHISRAELRFRRALNAAGGLSMAHVGRAKAYYETDDSEPVRSTKAKSRKQSLTKWTAIPDDSQDDGMVNIVINAPKKPAQVASSGFGMSTLAARKDLESYFDGLDTQIHKQERKHVSEVLQRLSGSGSSSGDAASDKTAGRGRDSRSDGKGRRRDNSMLRLLEKAMRTHQFRRQVSSLKSQLHVDWHTE
jgi:hypothetical protein